MSTQNKDVSSYTMTFVDKSGKTPKTHVWQFPMPERIAQPGDVYRATTDFGTLGKKSYEPGDTFKMLRRTQEAPFGRLSGLGNCVIQTKYHVAGGESIWSCFDDAIQMGWLELVSSSDASETG